jgi:hypothetical protein
MSTETFGTYVVEGYAPSASVGDPGLMVARTREAAAAASGGGDRVRYLRSVYLSADETWFHVCEATTPDRVADACRRAGFAPERIVAAELVLDSESPALPTAPISGGSAARAKVLQDQKELP